MKIFHTADWHLGKLVQGIYMTEDQREVLAQFIAAVEQERPDAVVIAGDLYDRAIPPTDAVELLNDTLERLVIDLNTPVLAIAGNHDSPDRVNFATRILEGRGLHLVGQLRLDGHPVVLKDEYGEVHFHLVPYADPAQLRYLLEDDAIHTHDDALQTVISRIASKLEPAARHVFVGHAFVTPGGAPQANTSESERPLSVGGAEQVKAEYFSPFHYTALGHLHQAHHVLAENIRYAGSPLKYSISEEHHKKGFLVVEIDGFGMVTVEQRELKPRRDVRRVTGTIEDIETHQGSDDYVFVTLLNENPVLFPMEKVRAIYPNALHVERMLRADQGANGDEEGIVRSRRKNADPVALFASFYKEVRGIELSDEKRASFAAAFAEVLREEGSAV